MVNPTSGSSSRVKAWPERTEKPNEWWGQFHGLPEPGDVERLRMFVQPQNMGKDEQERILNNWKASVAGHDNENVLGLSHHLRPSTPRSERLEKQVRRLEDANYEVTNEAKGLMKAHYDTNSGLLESLRHYCQGEDHVPIAYVNELMKMTDQLMLESAKQLDMKSRAHRTEVEGLQAKLKDTQSDLEKSQAELEESIASLEESQADLLAMSHSSVGKDEPKKEDKWWKEAEGHMQDNIVDLIKRLDTKTKDFKESQRKLEELKAAYEELQASQNREDSKKGSSSKEETSHRSRYVGRLRRAATLFSRSNPPRR